MMPGIWRLPIPLKMMKSSKMWTPGSVGDGPGRVAHRDELRDGHLQGGLVRLVGGSRAGSRGRGVRVISMWQPITWVTGRCR